MTHRDEDEEIIDTALDTLAWQRRKIDRLKAALGNLINAYIANVDTYRLGGFYTDPETEDEVIEARAALEG